MSKEVQKTEIRMNVPENIVQKLEKLKDFYGIENNTALVSFLISKEYNTLNLTNMSNIVTEFKHILQDLLESLEQIEDSKLDKK